MNAKHALVGGILAGVAASLCCVAPLVLLGLGLGGAWVANLSVFVPVRPLFLGLTLLFLYVAFRRLYPSGRSCEPASPCADGATPRRQRLIFWLVAIAVSGLVSFPWYAPLFY